MLDAILATLDGLDENLTTHYVEKDGKFHLDVKSVDGFALENIIGLKNSLAASRNDHTKSSTLLKQFGDLTPEQALEAIDKVKEMANFSSDDKVQEQIKAATEEIKKKFGIDLETANASTKSANDQLENLLITEAIRSAFDGCEKKLIDNSLELIMPHLKSKIGLIDKDGIKVPVVYGENRVPRLSMLQGNTDDMAISEYVNEISLDAKFSPFFQGSGASGTKKPTNNPEGNDERQKGDTSGGPGPIVFQDADAAFIEANKD